MPEVFLKNSAVAISFSEFSLRRILTLLIGETPLCHESLSLEDLS